MGTKNFKMAVLIVLGTGLSACGGGSGTGQVAPTLATATGNGMLGPVSGATVEATDLNETVTYGSATTASDGSYTLDMQTKPTGAFMITMSGGTYIDETTGQSTTQSQALHAVIPSLSGSTVSVAVTPLTEIAYQLYKSGYHDANTEVAEMFFGTSGLVSDVTATMPTNPSDTLEDDAAGQYEYVLAQVSKAANTTSEDSSAWAVSQGSSIVSTANGGSSASVSLPSSPSGVTTATGFTIPSGTSIAFTNTTSYTTPTLLTNTSKTLLWLNASTGITKSGSNVTEWDDQSGNGIHCALQGVYGGDNTPTTDPVYVASSQGSQPAVSFDGNSNKNDKFVCNDVYTDGTSNAFNSFSSITVIYVANGANTSSGSVTDSNGVIYNSVWSSTLNSSGFIAASMNLSGQSVQDSELSWDATNTQIVTVTFNIGSQSSISVWNNTLGSIVGTNGIAMSLLDFVGTAPNINTSTASQVSGLPSAYTNANSTTGTAAGYYPVQGGLSIGGGFAGNIQEIVILQNSSDAAAVETYLASKYNLSASGL